MVQKVWIHISDILFELKSFWGRLLSQPLQLDPSAENYLNLGCGEGIIPNFINVDFFGTQNANYFCDFRYLPLKIPSNSIDGIFSEHTFEHLTYSDADKLMAESFRILKKDGWFRMIVPDVSIFIENYAQKNDAFFKKWERIMFTESVDPARRRRVLGTKLQALSFVTQEHYHFSSWDFETAEYFLKKNGFRNITQSEHLGAKAPALNKDSSFEDRVFISLYVDAQK